MPNHPLRANAQHAPHSRPLRAVNVIDQSYDAIGDSIRVSSRCRVPRVVTLDTAPSI